MKPQWKQHCRAIVNIMTKSERAQHLLEDGFITEVINELKSSKISDIMNTNEGDVEARERAYTVIKTLDLIYGHIESLAADTKIKEKKWKIL